MELWRDELLPPNRFLAGLRQEILTHNPKRCPKWRFRFADDLVVQIQPKPSLVQSDWDRQRGAKQQVELYQVIALQGHGITVEAFSKQDRTLTELHFELSGKQDEGHWTLRPRRVPRLRTAAVWAPLLAVRRAVLAALPKLERIDPSLMFEPACIYCGKALTDPASMARWIGPECAKSSSLSSVRSWTIAEDATEGGAPRLS
jgi:hypothetical protein